MMLLLAISSLLIVGCGEPDFAVQEKSYEAKIVVEGFLYGGLAIDNIRIGRNYPIGVPVDQTKMALTPQDNAVVASINGTPLQFDAVRKTYFTNQIIVEPGKQYTLSVTAKIDGKSLQTTSTTIVPQSGFKVISNKNLGNVTYNQDPVFFDITTSPGSALYLFTFRADSASVKNYIYENNFEDKVDTADVAENLNDYKSTYDAVLDMSEAPGFTYRYEMDYFRTRFYSSYRAIIYACDKNYKNYLLSSTQVEELDGNYHEPVTVLTGDGIGVFGSAIKDTVRFTVIK